MDLFDYQAEEARKEHQPLAEKLRPRTLAEFVGQDHLVGSEGLIRRAVEKDRVFSMILWGPPGCGKTTLARIIARETRCRFHHFSAVLSGVREIRAVIDDARQALKLHRKRTILFVDEIHRFNKAQQDAFLHHVESGLITLIGATTENPSFEVIAPLLSRCRVLPLKRLTDKEIGRIIDRAIDDADSALGREDLKLDSRARRYLIRLADGDARVALNSLDIAVAVIAAEGEEPARGSTRIGVEELQDALQKKTLLYDKSGEEHYNLISALHKSLRGSDPDAALYWLFRMLDAGEDPLYVARRMVRFASEDIGNADPRALRLALDATESFRFLGHPEGELALAQCAVYLATAPKSNSVYRAVAAVRDEIRTSGALPVPLHIRNAPTRLMKEMGYGAHYRYAHDDPAGYVPQEYMPEGMEDRQYYHPVERGFEKTIAERMRYWRRLKTDGKDPRKKK